jgi:hypothetical protein
VALGVVILALLAWVALADADVLYNNLTGSVKTQFNRDVAGNTVDLDKPSGIWAKDSLGLSFPFEVKYTTPLLIYTTRSGSRGRCASAEIIGSSVLSRVMMIGRSAYLDYVFQCRPISPSPH